MNQTQIARKLLEFNKTIFDKTFSTLTVLQDHQERLIAGSLEKLPIPDEGKTAIIEWTGLYKKSSENSKALLDEGYKRMARYLDQAENKQNTMSM